VGIVRLIGSGRVQVDFNHRLAGRTLIYDLEVTKKLDDENEKVRSLIKRRLPIDDQKIKFNIEGTRVQIDLPEETFLADGLQVIKGALSNDIFKFVPRIDIAKFVETYASKPSISKKQDEPQQQSLEKSTEASQPTSA
jgi:peptidylprolyl isomerase